MYSVFNQTRTENRVQILRSCQHLKTGLDILVNFLVQDIMSKQCCNILEPKHNNDTMDHKYYLHFTLCLFKSHDDTMCLER